MVEWLAAQGHEVRVITAPPYYPQWQVGENYSAWRYKRERGAATVWRCPLYVPKQPSTLETPVASRQFCRQQFLSADGATSLEAGSHYRRGANAVLHARNAPAGGNCLVRARCSIFRITKWTPCWGWALPEKVKAAKWHSWQRRSNVSGLHNVDNVSTISRSMMNRAIEKGVAAENVIFFPNWSEIARFQHVADADVDALRNQLGLPDNKKSFFTPAILVKSRGWKTLLKLPIACAMNRLFCHCRAGRRQSAAGKNGAAAWTAQHAIFPLQSYDALPALLKMGDCHLVVQKRGAADAVLPSKLTNILAVGGNAVITAEAHTELGQLGETFPGIAVCVEPESVEALVAGIRQALLLPKHNTVAREYAERTLDKENVLRQFINDIRGYYGAVETLSSCDGRWLR